MKYPHQPATLASLVALLLHGIAVAQEQPLDRVTVTAPRLHDLPSSPVWLEAEQLAPRRAATSDSAALLRGTPGVTLHGAGGVSSLPAIHGLAADRLRIKVDGIDLISYCPNHMNPPLSYIDPNQIGALRVVAGLTPVSLGGDSIGGAIQVQSHPARFAAPGEGVLTEAEAGLHYRSNGAGRGANLAVTLASEQVSLHYSGAVARSGNLRAANTFKPAGAAAAGRGWLDGDEIGSTHYDSRNHELGLAVRSGHHQTELKLGLQEIPYQAWPNQRMDMVGDDGKPGNASNRFNLLHSVTLDNGELRLRSWHERTRHRMQFGDDKLYWYGSNDGTTFPDGEACTPAGGGNGCAAGMPMDTRGSNSGLTVHAEIALSSRDLLRVGGEAQRFRLDDWWEASGRGMWPGSFWNINGGQRDRLAGFAEWEAQWNPRWATLLGLRGEQVRMDAAEVQGYSASFSQEDAAAFNAAERRKVDHNLDLTALTRLTPDANRTVEFGYARKVRSPNLYERYAWSTHGMAMRMVNMVGDGNGYVGTIDLQPETAHTVSATLAWHDAGRARWEVALTPHFTHIENYIDAERCGPDDGQAQGGSCTQENLSRSDGFVYLKYANHSARIYGLDLTGQAALVEQGRYGDLGLSGRVGYTRGHNRSSGDALYHILPLNAALALHQRLGAWESSLEWEWVDAKRRVSAVRNEMQTAAYQLVHLRGSYTWRQLRLDVGVENLFNRAYDDPLGGAYVGQGKTMTGGDLAWGTPVPGPGRSFYTALRLQF